MGKKDKRVDAYIAKSADFAKPILKHVRELVHKGCPDLEETIKWGFPHFDHLGMMCSMAAFKQHCAFNFWKAPLLKDPHKALHQRGESSMGHLGKILSLKDLPSDKIFLDLVRQAAALNEDGVKLPPRPKPAVKKDVVVPDFFIKAVRKNKTAHATFEGFSPSHKREYVEWITEAKTDETREKRLTTAIEWMAEGKSRNWKYKR